MDRLSKLTRLRILLYLAQRGQCVLPMAALQRAGRKAGLNGAEMAANRAGTSHDAKATVCLGFVKALADLGQPPTASERQRMQQVGYSPAVIREVIALVGGIAAPGEIMNCSQLDSRALDEV